MLGKCSSLSSSKFVVAISVFETRPHSAASAGTHCRLGLPQTHKDLPAGIKGMYPACLAPIKLQKYIKNKILQMAK